mmetsp:Transcript_6109/g.27434  ORF Transcript_6109/g.27434 Transcript_6109/m.27434 type:complete len:205 (+) Transcript_6109:542-1156(+)
MGSKRRKDWSRLGYTATSRAWTTRWRRCSCPRTSSRGSRRSAGGKSSGTATWSRLRRSGSSTPNGFARTRGRGGRSRAPGTCTSAGSPRGRGSARCTGTYSGQRWRGSGTTWNRARSCTRGCRRGTRTRSIRFSSTTGSRSRSATGSGISTSSCKAPRTRTSSTASCRTTRSRWSRGNTGLGRTTGCGTTRVQRRRGGWRSSWS